MRALSTRHLLALVAILLLACALRVYHLDAQSLWNDEGTSIALAGRDIPTILQNASDDIHPPLYYVLLHFWIGVFGNSEAGARSLSVLIGVLVVAGTYLLGRFVLPRRGALLAALLAALSPFQVYYSQEARMYILGTLAALALTGACGALWTAWERRPSLLSRESLAVVLAGLVVLYTHYYGASVLLAVNAAFLIWLGLRRVGSAVRMGALWRWAVLMLVAIAGFVPWLLKAWHTISNWPAVSAPQTLLQLARALMVVLPLGITVPVNGTSTALGLLTAVLAIAGLYCMILRARQETGRASWRPWLVFCYLAVPLAIMYLGSLRRPMYNPKFILLATPALHVLLAGGITAIALYRERSASPRLRLASVAAAAVFTTTLIGGSIWSLDHLYTDPAYARDDYRAIVSYIEATAGPHAAILINAPSQIETVAYYHQGDPPMYPLARQRPMDVEQTLSELEQIAQEHDQLYGIFWATADSDPDGVIETWLAEHAFKTMDRWYGNIRLVVYSTLDQASQASFVPLDARFGDDIRLTGYRLFPNAPRSGEILQLSLEWEATQPVETRYTVFAQLLDARQHIVGQHDSEPGGGSQPTVDWVPGQIVQDNHGILIQPGTIPGAVTLIVGLYDPATGARLAVTFDGNPAGDALPLGTVQVSSPVRLATLAELNIEERDDRAWAGLGLVGHSLYPVGQSHVSDPVVRPGQAMELVLYWRKEGDVAPEEMRLALTNHIGQVVWDEVIQPCYGEYPWDQWREGEIVRDIRQFVLPNDLARETLNLTLSPVPESLGRRLVLERLRITPDE